MSKVLVAVGLVVVALGGSMNAQDRPDLSGSWVLAADKTTPAGAAGALGKACVIQQTATAVTVESAVTGQRMVMTGNGQPPSTEAMEIKTTTEFAFDGADHELQRKIEGMEMAGMPGGVSSTPAPQMYRATWTTGQFVILTMNPAGAPLARLTRMALTLDADGQLIVDSLSIVQPRAGAAKQEAPVPSRSVYLKKK